MADSPASTLAPSPAHRRRAALSVLEPLLGRANTVQALARFNDRLRSDTVADIIGFVDAVATGTRLDDAARRGLYASLHAALRQADDRLPPDPLPDMQALLGTVRPTPAVAPAGWPSAPAADQRITDAPQAVFTAVLRGVVDALRARHAMHWVAFQQAALAQFERAHVSPLAREGACAAWHQADLRHCRVPGQPAELQELVHRLYVALCDTLGPQDADDVLTRAFRQAMQIPEAAAYPPARLL